MTAGEDPSRDAQRAAFADEPLLPDGEAFPPDPVNDPPSEPQRSFVEDLRDLASDARILLEAEKAFQTARIGYVVGRGKSIAAELVVALVFVHLALIALVVGLLLALTPLLTAWGALAVVTLVLALGAAVCVLLALRQVRRVRGVLAGNDPAHGDTP